MSQFLLDERGIRERIFLIKQIFNIASKLNSEMYGNLNDSKRETKLEKVILCASVATVLVLVQLPYEKINDNPVPTVIFKDSPSLFHGFILSLNFSFFGSFVTIYSRERWPRLAKCCLSLAVVSAAIGAAILGWLVALPWISELGKALCLIH